MSIFHEYLRKTAKMLKGLYYRKRLEKAALIAGKSFHLSSNGFIFESESLKPKFYLPYYKSEFIQQTIVSTGDYYDKSALGYVANVVMGGAVSKLIKGNYVLDIGANIGNHTLYFLFECGAAMVHCFEPIKETYGFLQKNVELNDLQDVTTLHNVGVGAKSSMANMVSFNSSNMGSTEIDYNESGDIPIVAIDDLQFERKIALIKIDVEGFEYEVVKGMLKTVKRHSPYIIIEIRDKFFNDIEKILGSMGYWYINISKGNNYLFIPKHYPNHKES